MCENSIYISCMNIPAYCDTLTLGLLAIPAGQTKGTNTASSVLVTGGVVEAVEVSAGWKEA